MEPMEPMDFPEEVKEKLGFLFDEVLKIAPEFQEVLDKAKAGEISEYQAMLQMMEISAANPEINAKLLALTQGDREEEPEKTTDLVRHDLDPKLYFQKKKGLPQLNPILQGAIAERLQFDGDVPELRHTMLMPGATPAVSVETKALSPVAIGEQIQRAEDEVEEKVRAHQKQIAESIQEEVIEATHDHTLPVPTNFMEQTLAKYDRPEADLPEYRRGEVPAPVKIGKASGSALAKLSKEDRQGFSWKAVATTQGRRTVVPILGEILEKALKNSGWENILVGEADEDSWEFLFDASWSLKIEDGKKSLSPDFSTVHLASAVLVTKIRQGLDPAYKDKGILLDVKPINNISDRVVGWTVGVSQEVAHV